VVERKLANGFDRNGHNVYFFSDRDVARYGMIFRSSRAGRGVANARFLELARKFEPELIVIQHSSLIATASLAEAKETRGRPRGALASAERNGRSGSPRRFQRRQALDRVDNGVRPLHISERGGDRRRSQAEAGDLRR
jgi:hypothetical protein